ncbi:conjugative transposon protein TraJ [Flavobacterium sp. Sd200]|uniref:conjugative transposon protein TraJ n=1 Tax=Flavobacterium sp. Sd200 TaxID=2692211 RepID=UPI00137116BE|nr:conjugative transposon protein TraJ [Flavobacterium sp. Sd200]MXN91166.1 conjugative transposon protein TraJ [Flavobacterium sp. Sd200]
MKRTTKTALLVVTGLLLPFFSNAQGIGSELQSMHGVLEELYDEMIPLCSQLISVGQGIAGFAALWYISSRVWRHLANAEPIDFYPLFRPFALGMCVLMFPSVLGIINGVMKPTVTATAAMVEGSDKAIERLLAEKERAIKETDTWKMYVGSDGNGDRDRWYKYTHDGADPDNEGMVAGIGNDIKFAMSKAMYNFRNSVKEWMSEVLEVLFQAAALCIDTLRTFQLVVLAILGPLVFGISVFDGLQHTLTAWLSRYINIFLWLPVANIFGAIIGKIQEKMLELDLQQIGQAGDTFFSKQDVAYLIFMIIGIVGYFTVPSVANYIVHAGGGSALGQKVTSIFSSTTSGTVQMVGGRSMDTAKSIGNMGSDFNKGLSGQESGSGLSGAVGRSAGYGGAYMADKLTGNKE